MMRSPVSMLTCLLFSSVLNLSVALNASAQVLCSQLCLDNAPLVQSSDDPSLCVTADDLCDPEGLSEDYLYCSDLGAEECPLPEEPELSPREKFIADMQELHALIRDCAQLKLKKVKDCRNMQKGFRTFEKLANKLVKPEQK